MKYIKNGFIFVLFVVLSSCQTPAEVESIKNKARASHVKAKSSVAEKKDSAPFGVIPRFFKRIIPKHESLSRYGNPGSYRVFGKKYNVLTTSKGYHEKGLASWYGTKFHRMRTSSGDAYNMYELTAAHKTLPLPTYIRVKNLDNGREAIVKVNDRGPFFGGRIIDLSYGAAVKLGVFPKGTAHVEIEAISSPGKATVGHYYLQVGVYKSAKLAESFQHRVKKSTSVRVFVEKYKHQFIVKIGPFSNKSMCEQVQTKLKRQGIKGSLLLK